MPQATYVIQQGDTYGSIAQRLQKITSQVLEDANPNHPPNKLQVDVQIEIPILDPLADVLAHELVFGAPAHPELATIYVIQQGDTYDNIAQRLQKITIQMLEDANPDYPPNNLQVGNRINIHI